MTLYAELFAGNQKLGWTVISNEGHPVTRDHPSDDDLREYLYVIGATDPDVPLIQYPRGRVQHRRSEGAWELLRKVLNDAQDHLQGGKQ